MNCFSFISKRHIQVQYGQLKVLSKQILHLIYKSLGIASFAKSDIHCCKISISSNGI